MIIDRLIILFKFDCCIDHLVTFLRKEEICMNLLNVVCNVDIYLFSESSTFYEQASSTPQTQHSLDLYGKQFICIVLFYNIQIFIILNRLFRDQNGLQNKCVIHINLIVHFHGHPKLLFCPFSIISFITGQLFVVCGGVLGLMLCCVLAALVILYRKTSTHITSKWEEDV